MANTMRQAKATLVPSDVLSHCPLSARLGEGHVLRNRYYVQSEKEEDSSRCNRMIKSEKKSWKTEEIQN